MGKSFARARRTAKVRGTFILGRIVGPRDTNPYLLPFLHTSIYLSIYLSMYLSIFLSVWIVTLLGPIWDPVCTNALCIYCFISGPKSGPSSAYTSLIKQIQSWVCCEQNEKTPMRRHTHTYTLTHKHKCAAMKGLRPIRDTHTY